MRHTKEYETWKHIRARCSNAADINYPKYGAKGIAVCERWQKSFEAFYEDMGSAPGPRHTLDRYPNGDGNYEPGNCRWATYSEQNRNKRNNKMVEFNGQSKCLADWCDQFGLNYPLVAARIDLGWDAERAFFAPKARGFT